jgi:hypothetical protein
MVDPSPSLVIENLEEKPPKKLESINQEQNQRPCIGVAQKKNPPYPKIVEHLKTLIEFEFELLGKIENLCFKIPLLQTIKDVPIYNKINKELCIKRLGRKKKNPPNINVVGQLVDRIVGNIFTPKYTHSGIPIVNVYIPN